MISKKSIKEIKAQIEDKNLIDLDEKESLDKKKLNISTDNIELANLLIKCYDILKDNINAFDNEELKKYMKELDITEIRILLTEINDTCDISNYMNSSRINRIINQDRDSYVDLINMFYELFGEED